ncbi:MAG TPA: PQQ-dependent sugar dehydrogenase [Planctomycetota bacterium]|nr:PQQ-dependent sugar dehydrogenase [Planctomycetota bacterium]
MIHLVAVALLSLSQDRQIPETGFEVAFEKLKFERVVVIAHPSDGTDRLFVVEQPGRVRWFENKADAAESVLALDLTDKVLSTGNEEGLLGMAFHPKFKENHQVFLQYSFPKLGLKLGDKRKRYQDTRNVISRFEMDAEHKRILPETEKTILWIAQPFENHNGGVLQFGPDGYLYIGLGDGGAAGDPTENAQDLMTFLGKFLRIDVDHQDPNKAYAVPKDNPFVGKEGCLPEIWSLGWRNPWGYHFDRKTGDLWSGDVGQDKWEEVNIVKKGGNYGWKIREAKHDFKGGEGGPFEEPIVEHGHISKKDATDGMNSLTGGCMYRGKRLPGLDGVYLYGDFVTGNMWGLKWDGRKVAESRMLFPFALKQIATFGEDRDGDVYWSCFTDGHLYRFKPEPQK